MMQLLIGIFVYLFCGVLTYLGFSMKLKKDVKEFYDDESAEMGMDLGAKIFIILLWFKMYKITFLSPNDNIMEVVEFRRKFFQDDDENF